MNCPQCKHALRDEARFCDNCGLSIATFVATTDETELQGNIEPLHPPDPLIGQVLDTKYELLARLGEGGMGTVYRGLRVHIRDEVAVKVLLQKYVADAASVERFRREARAAAMLRHQNIVAIYDYSEARGDDAPAYIVMELIEGASLRALLKDECKLKPLRSAELMRDICAGVGAAHRRNVFHRDLKPDNVIVLPPDEDRERETVKVVDFGIAKLRDASGTPTLTETGVVVGTPYYMSPEQCRGETYDARSDVYSLGALLYEMLAGTPPFMGESIASVIAKHLFETPQPLAPVLEVAPALEAVVMRALAKEPAQRHADATAFARELREAEDEQRRHEEELERLRAEAEARRLAEEAQRRADVEAALQREQEARRKRKEERRKQEEERQQREAAAALAAEEQRRKAEEDEKRCEAETQHLRAQQAKRERLATEKAAHAMRRAEYPTLNRATVVERARAQAALLKRQTLKRKVMIGGAAIIAVFLAVGSLVWMLGARGNIQPSVENASPSPPVNSSPAARPPTDTANTPVPPDKMVYVPGGEFMMGRNDGDEYERPAHRVTVKPFFIDSYEVTRADYLKFIEATGHRAPPNWSDGTHPSGAARKPVTGVTWDDANDYALWAKKRLPTEEEWELAARGKEARLYPWGFAWQKGMANANGATKGMTDVGSYKGASPFGAYDMVGNAWEWTASALAAYPGGRLPKQTLAGELKVIRGGAYMSTKEQATTTYRGGWPARGGGDYRNTGFRCAKAIAQ